MDIQDKELAKVLGLTWSESENVWLYGHGMGWTSQIEPELMQLISTHTNQARLDELECSTVPDYFIWNKDGLSMTIQERKAELQKKALSSRVSR